MEEFESMSEAKRVAHQNPNDMAYKLKELEEQKQDLLNTLKTVEEKLEEGIEINNNSVYRDGSAQMKSALNKAQDIIDKIGEKACR